MNYLTSSKTRSTQNSGHDRLQQLPEEVINLICEALSGDSSSLHKLGRVSRRYHRISRPYLYSAIKTARLEHLIKTLERKPELQHEVHSLTVTPVVKRARLMHSHWLIPNDIERLAVLLPVLDTLVIDSSIGIVDRKYFHRLLLFFKKQLASTLRRLELYSTAPYHISEPTIYGVSIDAVDAGELSRDEILQLLRSSKLEYLKLDSSVLTVSPPSSSRFSSIDGLPTRYMPTGLRSLHVRFVHHLVDPGTTELEDYGRFAGRVKEHLPCLERIHIELVNFREDGDVMGKFCEAFEAVDVVFESTFGSISPC